jgi:Ca2+-binding EF-hand superfamily protein
VSLLLDNRVSSISSWEVNDKIISKFDQDKDGSLDYSEFSKIFLPLGLDPKA